MKKYFYLPAGFFLMMLVFVTAIQTIHAEGKPQFSGIILEQ